MEIGFIMAAMKDSKPSTAFIFPMSATSQPRHTPPKPISFRKDEQRYSTDSGSSLKGKGIRVSQFVSLLMLDSLSGQDSEYKNEANCANKLTDLSKI